MLIVLYGATAVMAGLVPAIHALLHFGMSGFIYIVTVATGRSSAKRR
jgi:hypothetical protein